MTGRERMTLTMLTFSVGAWLVLAPAVFALDTSGVIARVDRGANVIGFADGSHVRILSNSVVLQDATAVQLDALQPGTAVSVRNGAAVIVVKGRYVTITEEPEDTPEPSASP